MLHFRSVVLFLALFGLILAIAPSGSASAQLADPIPQPIPATGEIVSLSTVATGLTAPNWGTSAPGLPGHLFVTDQPGTLWSIDLATGAKTAVLDVSGQITSLGIFGAGSFDERGLLGVAFHPNYATNGLLYTYTSEPVSGTADFSTMPVATAANHHSVITEWNVPDPANPSSAVNLASERELMRIDEPQFNHNAGALNFGPDGRLYISLGDGGGADDVDGPTFFGGPIVGHGSGNGQDPSNVLGTILRIDPTGSNSSNGQYGIPADNPFVGVGGFVDEIYAYGFRNPFRFSFDQAGGAMYIADVGQNDIEEIDIGTSGGNYGWNQKEGSFSFNANGNGAGFVTGPNPGVPAGLIDPIAEYDHDDGIAVVGGFVYRGSDVPGLAGKYVFGDFAQTFNNDGRLFHLEGGQIVEFQLSDRTALNLSLLGFGQDASGEVYIMANATGTPFGNTGVVLKFAASQAGGPPAVGGVVGLLDDAEASQSLAAPDGGSALPIAAVVVSVTAIALATGWYLRRRLSA